MASPPTLPKGPPDFGPRPGYQTPSSEFGWTIIAEGITMQYPVLSYIRMNDDEGRVEVYNIHDKLIGVCVYEHFVAFFAIETKNTGVTIHAPRRTQ